MEIIGTFSASCKNLICLHKFDAPLLPDQSYGQYIYFDTSGVGAKYYCGLNNSIWNFVSNIVDKSVRKHNPKKGVIIQEIIGRIAQKTVPGKGYTQNLICPKCKSRAKWINRDEMIRSIQIEHLKFTDFEHLSEKEKENWITELIRKFNKRC